jgi:hypothetical protein
MINIIAIRRREPYALLLLYEHGEREINREKLVRGNKKQTAHA